MDFHAAIFDGFFLVINRRVDPGFLGILQQEFEIVPEFRLVSDGFCGNVREFVDGHKGQGVLVDHLAIGIAALRVETKGDFLALVFTVSGILARRQGFNDAFGIVALDQSFDIVLVRELLSHVLDERLALARDAGQHVGGLVQLGSVADAVRVAVHGRDDALELERVAVPVHVPDDANDETQEYIGQNVELVHSLLKVMQYISFLRRLNPKMLLLLLLLRRVCKCTEPSLWDNNVATPNRDRIRQFSASEKKILHSSSFCTSFPCVSF